MTSILAHTLFGLDKTKTVCTRSALLARTLSDFLERGNVQQGGKLVDFTSPPHTNNA
jgi:hypothetical protein